MADAVQATGAKTKRNFAEPGLGPLVRPKRQECIRGFRGKLQWQRDLDAMRTGRWCWSPPGYGP